MKTAKSPSHPFLVQTSLGNRFLSEKEMLKLLPPPKGKPRGNSARRRQPIEVQTRKDGK